MNWECAMFTNVKPALLLLLLLPLVDVQSAFATPLGFLCTADGDDDYANFILILDPDTPPKGVMNIKGGGLDQEKMSDVGRGQIVGDSGEGANGRAYVGPTFFHIDADATIDGKRQHWFAWVNRSTDVVRLYYNKSSTGYVALNGRCDRVSPAEFR